MHHQMQNQDAYQGGFDVSARKTSVYLGHGPSDPSKGAALKQSVFSSAFGAKQSASKEEIIKIARQSRDDMVQRKSRLS